MASTLDTVTVDCADPRRLAEFWAASLAWSVDDADDDGAFVRPPERGSPGGSVAAKAIGLFFQKVPEPKTVKNRVHWDVRGQVDALEAHGATRLWEQPRWVTLADPEGNEFCVFE